jgi:hypothetical protein
MCRYEQQRNGEPCPNPGDSVCNSPSVGALTASVMAALATLDGICCALPTRHSDKRADEDLSFSLLVICPELGR